VRVAPAVPADIDELAAVAAETFPLACPPTTRAEDIASFIAANLSARQFAEYLRDQTRAVFVARQNSRILGYAMVIHRPPVDPDVRRAVTDDSAAELSKIYLLPGGHGGPAAAALLDAVFDQARARGAGCIWLGVNQKNARAQRFYTKHGFTVKGSKTFQLGAGIEDDYVMMRTLGDRADAPATTTTCCNRSHG
jgi:ribosomal protein S18 acetylase RimI-like enzyme